ncbi:MAG: DNA translocase FtsK [Bacteroidia bacterium]|nr:DNA translocase FtsK [Bacteroidia bacterium]
MAKKVNRENKENAYLSEEPEMKAPIPPAIETKTGKPTYKFWRDERLRKVLGLSAILFSLYLLVAFASYLFTWKIDQSLASNPGFSDFFAQNPDAADNWLGTLGAVLAHLFIYKGFGLASFAFVLIFFVIGFNTLFKAQLLPVKKVLQYAFFSVIWLSATTGLLLYGNMEIAGGTFGYHASLWLRSLLGTIGATLFLIFYALVFMVMVFNINFPKPSFNAAKTTDNNTPDAEQQETEEEEPESVPHNKVLAENESIPFEEDEAPVEEDSFKLVVKEKPAETLPTEKIAEAAIPVEKEIIPTEITAETKPEVVIPVEEKITPVEKEVVSTGSINTGEFTLNVQNTMETEEERVSEKSMEHIGLNEPYDPTLELSSYKFPTLDLLSEYPESKGKVGEDELKEKTNLIVETLRNYNIEIKKIQATVGPTVTLYEIIPVEGTRIAKIKNLEDDIALSLAALGIRIIAPMPGKGTIGIEVPNQYKAMVSIKSVLSSPKFTEAEMDLPIAFGRTITNEVFVTDLAKMPHMLMAGATGQGKSVGINTVLISLLYRKHPSSLKFVLVDPKKVELSIYKTIERHFLAKLPGEGEAIITDTKKVINTLNSLCIEMDARYDLLKDAQVRNIKEYNAKFIDRKLNPNNGHRFLPYVVVVIDELADLMMTAGKEVEHPIGRLAQLARAIGIHLILATQRPSVNIITGTIKANFPARLAFRVSSKIDSRTILDANGADQLIGKGDMLFSNGNDLIRLQCAFVDTPEVDKVAEYIGSQRGYPDAYILPEVKDESGEGGGAGDFDASERDSLFEEAARIIVQHQQGSTSLLQRRLKLGYNRAGRLIDQLEQAGVVGPFEGSKAREVLIPDEFALEQLLKNMDSTL